MASDRRQKTANLLAKAAKLPYGELFCAALRVKPRRFREAADLDMPSAEFDMMEHDAFIERAKNAYAVVQTGETALYGNIIIRKGVVRL